MKRSLAVVVPVLALIVAGCGSSNSSSSNSSSSSTPQTTSSAAAPPPATKKSSKAGASTRLKLSADPSGQLKFDKSALSAKSGNVSITMDNPSSVPHGVSVEGNGVDKDGQVVNKGGTSTVSVSLKPGKYTFYCPVPGHRQAGMEGTLTVK
jgi:uncharacterized cupredoxin-like copper-binding protein